MSKTAFLLFLFIVVPILLIQGFWIFKDARKRGYKLYWLFGILGLLNTPTNFLIYMVITRLIIDKRTKL